MKNLLLKFVLFLAAVQMFAITLPEGTNARVTDIEQDGDIILGAQLAEPTVLNTPIGKMLVGGPVLFYPNGKIAICFLAKNTRIHTSIGDIAAYYGRSEDYRVEFYESGALKRLYVDYYYVDDKGKKISFTSKVKTGLGEVALMPDSLLCFYDSGSPDKFILNEFKLDSTENKSLTYTCDAGTFKIQAYLNSDPYVQDHSGKVKTIYTSEESFKIKTPIGETFGKGGLNPIILNDDGSLFGFTTDELIVATIAGMKVNIPANSYLSFYPNGNVCDFTSSSKLTVDIAGKKLEFEDHSKFRASEDGKKIVGTYAYPIKRADGLAYDMDNSYFIEEFYDNGIPKKFDCSSRGCWMDSAVKYFVEADSDNRFLIGYSIQYYAYEKRLRLFDSKSYYLQANDNVNDVGMVYFAKDGTPLSYALYKVDGNGERILNSAHRPIVDEANKKKFSKITNY